MRAALLASALALVAHAKPAHAALLKLDESALQNGAATLRMSFSVDGRTYEIVGRSVHPQRPAPGAAMLVDFAPDDSLTPLAVSRGMPTVSLDLAKLPPGVRASALRDLVPRLRDIMGAKRAVARGKEETAAALIEAGVLFEGLLIQRSDPFTTPLEARGPKVIEVFGSDAYWRPGLVAIGAEALEGANRRRFFIAGVAEAPSASNCAAPVNRRAIAPALRALMIVLDAWTNGVKPPASRAPRLHDKGFSSANNLIWPTAPGLPTTVKDLRLAPIIDADGNEAVGLRLPDHALPIATHTGFNAPRDPKGAPCIAGATLPFASTKAEREKNNDPRPSLVERYGSRAYFVATMRVVADRLVKERLLLKEDADAYVAEAKNAPF